MQRKEISRRRFLNLSGTGIATGLATGRLLPESLFATDKNNTAKITAGEVMDRIKANVGIPWKAVTVDTIKGGGSPAIVVTGITTSFMATLEILEKSVKAGNNFILAHEPTF